MLAELQGMSSSSTGTCTPVFKRLMGNHRLSRLKSSASCNFEHNLCSSL